MENEGSENENEQLKEKIEDYLMPNNKIYEKTNKLENTQNLDQNTGETDPLKKKKKKERK